jgi:hypothetical protein
MKSHVAKLKVPMLETLPTSPLRVACPPCKALPMYDCATRSGVFSAVHVARIKAAARIDLEKKIIRSCDGQVPNTTLRFLFARLYFKRS